MTYREKLSELIECFEADLDKHHRVSSLIIDKSCPDDYFNIDKSKINPIGLCADLGLSGCKSCWNNVYTGETYNHGKLEQFIKEV